MNTIYTVTLNPALDYIISCKSLEPGQINRIETEMFVPGGKGVNISLVLKNFGVPTTATGYIGGFTGDELVRLLEKKGVATNFFRTNGGQTRVNVKIKEKLETEINAAGPTISENEINRLKSELSKLSEGDFLVLAGSVPKSVSDDIYMQIMSDLQRKGIKIAVDSENERLTSVLKYNPFVIKPNHKELGEIFNTEINSPEIASECAKKLVEKGAQNVIVSMAGKGAVFVNSEKSLYANAPTGTVKNSVGAGDSMLAGFLASVFEGKTLEEAFAVSVATGSSAAFSGLLGDKSYANQLLEQVKISEI